MPIPRKLAATGLALALIMPQMAQAAPKQCDFQPDIVALSDYVLKNRAGLPGSKKLRLGAISAYLKIRYQQMPAGEAGDMLMPLVEAGVSRADALMLSWAINAFGVETAISIAGPKTTDRLLTKGSDPSVLRAVVMKEGLPALAAQWGSLSPKQRMDAQMKLPLSLLDKPDSVKNELSQQAKASDMQDAAAGFAATARDPKAWSRFTSGVTDSKALEQSAYLWRWAPALVGNPEIERPNPDPGRATEREQLHKVMVASAVMPERDFLLTYANQSADNTSGAKVADTVITLAEDKSGEAWTMDHAWLVAYRKLLEVSPDPKSVDPALVSLPFYGLRHYGGSLRDALDWMIAADALRDDVQKGANLNTRPQLLSADFEDWDSWKTTADAIRAGGDLTPLYASPKTRAIAAELLFAAGMQHPLAAFITKAEPDGKTVELAEDFANRMDRICDGYLNFPAEAVIYPDTPLFRFD
jgi:hypothetical protein